MNIRSLENIDINTLYQSFNKAFFDYDMQLNAVEFENMLKRRGFNPKLSFGAFEEKELVSFTFNGIGLFKDQKTAYDTGTRKDYRGQGLATKIFQYSIPYLRDAGVKNYLLEVLQHNTAAFSIYRKLGFKITREFNYFIWDNNKEETKIYNANLQIKLLDDIKYDSLEPFWDFTPSWQNSIESIYR